MSVLLWLGAGQRGTTQEGTTVGHATAQPGAPWRARATAALVAVLAALSLAPLPAATALSPQELQDKRDALLRSRDAIEGASEELEVADAEVARVTVELQEVEARLAAARDRLDQLRLRLRGARSQERRAVWRNLQAVQQLGQATQVLDSTRHALSEHVADLGTGIVTAYKYGGSTAQLTGVFEALDQSSSVTEFLTAYDQLQIGTDNQAELVHTVEVLAGRVARQHVRVEQLQLRREQAEADARRYRHLTQDLTTRQRTLVAEIRVDRKQRRRLLARLEAEREQWEARIAELGATSQALAAELARHVFVAGAPGEGVLSWPTDGRVTSDFGYRVHPVYRTRRLHAGVDIPAPTGQTIHAAGDGTVVSAGPRGGYGNAVVIDHGNGLSTVYAHQSQTLVRTGQQVQAADVVGQVGSTGLSTGPHLHFEVRVNGNPQDPLNWF
ncbi:MAG: peptidoglycan DD-metalloendopeptidase family protein [Egibacteraceae bacterium]